MPTTLNPESINSKCELGFYNHYAKKFVPEIEDAQRALQQTRQLLRVLACGAEDAGFQNGWSVPAIYNHPSNNPFGVGMNSISIRTIWESDKVEPFQIIATITPERIMLRAYHSTLPKSGDAFTLYYKDLEDEHSANKHFPKAIAKTKHRLVRWAKNFKFK